MTTILLYDHFIALGGAEKVSFELANTIDDCEIQTAYADEKLFAQPLLDGKLKHFCYCYFNHWFPTFSLFLFYLFRYRVANDQFNLLATGVFAPLSLWRNRHVNKKLVYFHTFPSFVDLSYSQLTLKHGKGPAILFYCFIPLYLFCLRYALRHADVIFANSKSVCQRFSAIGIETRVLYPGVDLTGLVSGVDKGYFLSTARLESNKRVELIVEVFAQLKEPKLVMIGEGSMFCSLKQKYQHYNNIEFLGWLNPEEVKYWYSHCKALIYIPQMEYFGIAPVEAMAAGKPVIGVREGGLMETIDNQRLGTLINPPVELQELKQTIITYLSYTANHSDIEYRQQSAKRFRFSEFSRNISRHLD